MGECPPTCCAKAAATGGELHAADCPGDGCPGCGWMIGHAGGCALAFPPTEDPAPTFEAARLFEPGPAPMAGQRDLFDPDNERTRP